MNRLGVLIDVAHANDATIEDALRLTDKPLVSTHGAAFALCPHVRCSTDDQLYAIAGTGGLIGIVAYSAFLVPRPAQATIDTMVDHIAYVADLVGIEHVAIGTDLGALYGPGDTVIRTPADFLKLTARLLKRGFTVSDVKKVWGQNYLRVLRETIG
jgi:microsomal dipeptidase-like Zn-dependent dipeptidase